MTQNGSIQNNNSAVQYNKDIDVLHGFRAIFIFFVGNFHIWQQSWLPHYIMPFGKFISLDFLPRSGYVFVDGMILISAFLLYLPYIRQKTYGGEIASIPEFYSKKFARIVPSYILNILLLFFLLALPQKIYPSTGRAAKDFFSHIFFAQTFSYDTYVATPLNAGLWTVVIEMQAYLIMPWVFKYLFKKPVVTLSLMSIMAWGFRYYTYYYVADPNVWINQLPAFLDVYALGFIGAIVYTKLEQLFFKDKLKIWHKTLFTLVLICAIILTVSLLKYQASMNGQLAIKLGQLEIRLPLTLLMMIMILSAAFSFKVIKFSLSNKLIRFLAAISYNFYIWHQVLSVEMRKAFYDTEMLHSNMPMQQGFTLLCYSVAILVAAFVTFYFEKPMSKIILNRFNVFFNRRNKIEGPKS
ncbi:MAG: acyltransferase [Christensenellaceae bacterium]|nr:acyltransferase [Christensenellaceae bacterium]